MKLRDIALYSLSLIVLMGLFGCAHKKTKSHQFRKLSIGISKDRVAEILGEPTMFRGAIQTDNGPMEVFEYQVAQKRSVGSGNIAAHTALSILTFGLWIPVAIAIECSEDDRDTETYFLYFSNDRLVQWGQPTDWRRPEQPANHVQEFRFR